IVQVKINRLVCPFLRFHLYHPSVVRNLSARKNIPTALANLGSSDFFFRLFSNINSGFTISIIYILSSFEMVLNSSAISFANPPQIYNLEPSSQSRDSAIDLIFLAN